MPHTRDEIRTQVLQIATRELALQSETIVQLTDDTDLGEHLDSIQRLSLVVGIEDHFKICFEPEDDQQAITLADVVSIVERQMAPS